MFDFLSSFLGLTNLLKEHVLFLHPEKKTRLKTRLDNSPITALVKNMHGPSNSQARDVEMQVILWSLGLRKHGSSESFKMITRGPLPLSISLLIISN